MYICLFVQIYCTYTYTPTYRMPGVVSMLPNHLECCIHVLGCLHIHIHTDIFMRVQIYIISQRDCMPILWALVTWFVDNKKVS